MIFLTRPLAWTCLLATIAAGCRSSVPASAPAATFSDLPSSQPDGRHYHPAIRATVTPPPGWTLEVKPQTRSNVSHYLWISPSGNTAFGVMRFSLPIPTPHDPVLWIFLSEMRRIEGEANLLSKVWDSRLRGLRFDVEGGRYRMRTNFTIRGLSGWMSYAGTLRENPIDQEELRAAEQARESTAFGGR